MDRKIQQTRPQTASLEQAFPLYKLLSRQLTMEIKIIALRKEEVRLQLNKTSFHILCTNSGALTKCTIKDKSALILK
jgi:hypothetical protein